MLKEKPDLSIIKEHGNHGGQQQPEFEPLELSFAGKHYLAVPARIDSDCGVGEKVNVVNMEGCLIRGSLVIDQKQYFVISDDCKEKVIPGNDHIWEILTDRELQIAILVSRGKINKQIAHQLSISEYTVATYMRRIFAKLGVSSRAAMVACLVECLTPSVKCSVSLLANHHKGGPDRPEHRVSPVIEACRACSGDLMDKD